MKSLLLALASPAFVTALAGVAVGLDARAGGAADNLLLNPGFEEGTESWEVLRGSFSADSSRRHEGERSVHVTTAPDRPSEAQLVQSGVAQGGNWVGTIFVASEPEQVGFVSLTLEFYAGSTGLGSTTEMLPLPLAGFQPISLTAHAASNATSFRLLIIVRGEEAATTASLDAASLTFEPESPEPTPSPTPTPPEEPTPSPTPDGSDESDESDSELGPTSTLRNGTFESGDDGLTRHWRVEGGALIHSTVLARSGLAAGQVQGNLATPVEISQTLSLLTVGDREFAVHALGRAENSTVRLGVQWLMLADQPFGEPTYGEPVELDGVGYEQISLVATPPPRAAGAILSITVSNGASGADVYLDDASWRLAKSTSSGSGGGSAPTSPRSSGGSTSSAAIPADLGVLSTSSYEVLINEVFYRPDAEEEVEWVELTNAGDAPVVLDGWTVADNHASFELGPYVLAQGGYLLIIGGNVMPAGARGGMLAPGGKIGNGLANDGDRLVLLDAEGALVDALSYGDDVSVLSPAIVDVGAGQSLSRRAGAADHDTASDFVSSVPTPGRGLLPFVGPEDSGGAPAVPMAPSTDSEESEEADAEAIDDGQTPTDTGVASWKVLVAFGVAGGTLVTVVSWLNRAQIRRRWGR